MRFALLLPMLLFGCAAAPTQTTSKAAATKPLSQQMADSFIGWYPDSLGPAQNRVARWGYEQGVALKGR